ncbi:MAG: ABC transporter ATP-binding protein [Clostridia bacterium]|nr:ABC transporter ATP-binding protein [Clostridia bacterium]
MPKRLFELIKPHWKSFAISILLVLLLTAFDIYRPIVIGNAIDQFITGNYAPGEAVDERFHGVLLAAGQYIVVLIAIFICNRFQFLIIQKTGQDIIYDLRNKLFEHTEGLDMRFFDVTPVGKVVTRITNDVEAIGEVSSNILVRLFQNVVKIIGLMIIMLSLNARMALFSFILLPIVACLTYIFRRISRKAFRITKTKVTALNTFLSEHLSGMRVIQLFAREEKKHEAFKEKSEDLYRANFREIMVNALFRPGTYLLSIAALAIVIAVGSASVLESTISLGLLYVFIQYINQLFTPVQDLAEQFSTLQSATASAEKIFTLLDTKATIRDAESPTVLPAIRGRIEFDHVWFAYEKENWILKDVSFVIEPGQRVAFVGATGAGKTSILSLIGRYYDIQKGEIRIDGVDIKKLRMEDIRRAIGQVQQDVFIFTGDIASNIRLRNEAITDEALKEASVHVNASRFIERLPEQYHEPVSERGATFSSGQRQLLSFARTLAYDPRILILDEATSNIDTETEQWIQEATERLMKGRTTIMVAHRLSTIQHADRIIVMHHGRIRESGTHQELLEMDGIYKKLYQLQLT